MTVNSTIISLHISGTLKDFAISIDQMKKRKVLVLPRKDFGVFFIICFYHLMPRPELR